MTYAIPIFLFTMLLAAVGGIACRTIWIAKKSKGRDAQASKLNEKLKTKAKTLIRLLTNDPNDDGVHQELLRIQAIVPTISTAIYNSALGCVEITNGSSRTKQFALAAGRHKYGHVRENGVPTIYDEQAIQNDIIARSESSL